MEFIYTLPLLQIHITAVFATFALVILSDTHGLLWILGKLKTLPKKRMEFFHIAVWFGLVTIVTAGFLMFISYPGYLLSLPAFRLKMLFVFFLLVNAFVIGKHLHTATSTAFKDVPKKEQLFLLISGAISTIGWIGAYTCAQFLS